MKIDELDKHALFSKLVQARQALRSAQASIHEIEIDTNAPLKTDCVESAQALAVLQGHVDDLKRIVVEQFRK